MSSDRRRWRTTLAARIALVFLVLLLAVQLASFAALRFSLSRHARNELPTRVSEGAQLLQSLLDNQVQTAIVQARGLARDFGFYSVLLEGDPATAVSALENFKTRVHATRVAFLDLDFNVRYASTRDALDEV